MPTFVPSPPPIPVAPTLLSPGFGAVYAAMGFLLMIGILVGTAGGVAALASHVRHRRHGTGAAQPAWMAAATGARRDVLADDVEPDARAAGSARPGAEAVGSASRRTRGPLGRGRADRGSTP